MNKLKIWIDLTNSPHVNFFKPFINDWQSEGHQIIITSRDLANTIDLINQNGWHHQTIGEHVGKNLFKKIFYFPNRVVKLYKYLKTQRPDIAISQSSFYSPVTAWMLNVPSIYLNDNEHAKGNYIAFLFASVVLLPEALKNLYSNTFLEKMFRIDFYPGIKEGIYLSKLNLEQKEYNVGKEKKNIYVRLEPITAQYYNGDSFELDNLLIKLKDIHNVYILPRNKKQIDYYKSQKFEGINVLLTSLYLNDIYKDCDLFIGAGGSMTREMAFLGVPTISIYQSALLEVDKYLISIGMLKHQKTLSLEIVQNFLSNFNIDTSLALKNKGINAFQKIKTKVYEYAKN
jgi:predicted glycosyltransferase